MELGNMCFGNSRGPIKVPRSLVDSEEWITLIHEELQVEDYHCIINKDGYYFDYNEMETKERTNGIKPNEYGGYSLVKNGKIIFEIFPYWWGECTCGIEEKNENNIDNLEREIFTQEELKIYNAFYDWCDDECPACSWKPENRNKSKDELLKICTCGTQLKNKKLKEQKELIKDKINEFEKKEKEIYIDHDKNCLLLKHNFVYHPNEDDEFWIDWYKYPFRDSYMNKSLTENEIKEIFKDCINEFRTREK